MTAPRGAHLHLDCFAGLAGDMVLGALLDLGVPRAVVDDAIAALGLPAVSLEIAAVRRGGLAGTKVEVLHRGVRAGAAHGPVHAADGHDDHTHDHHAHVHHAEVRSLLERRCEPAIARGALAIYDALAAVEARRHGVPLAEVAFHELGAADSIADIVGVAAAWAWLAPIGASCRVIPTGGGSVRTAHGRLPVPAPATLELLRDLLVEGGGTSELTTPTGAAIVRALAGPLGPGGRLVQGDLPAGRVLGVGWGAGTRELADRPNLLRIVALAPAAQAEGTDQVELLEANLDDLQPVLVAPLVDALLAAGAVDAWITPIVMKKGRAAHLVSALAPPAARAAIEAVFFRDSTTIGVRRSRWDRTVLDRELVELDTELGPVTAKVAGRRDGQGGWAEIHSVTPELEACRRVAEARGVPLRRVYEIAAAAAATRRRT